MQSKDRHNGTNIFILGNFLKKQSTKKITLYPNNKELEFSPNSVDFCGFNNNTTGHNNVLSNVFGPHLRSFVLIISKYGDLNILLKNGNMGLPVDAILYIK